MKQEPHPNKKETFVYCSTCRKYQPAIIEYFFSSIKGGKLKKDIMFVACGICKYVQNLNREPKIKHIRYSELKKKGYKILKNPL